jgi:hypothetical protein
MKDLLRGCLFTGFGLDHCRTNSPELAGAKKSMAAGIASVRWKS